MSTPEWMQKYQEIGQKEDEGVTEMGRDGFLKRAESRRNSLLIEQGEDSNEFSETVPLATTEKASVEMVRSTRSDPPDSVSGNARDFTYETESKSANDGYDQTSYIDESKYGGSASDAAPMSSAQDDNVSSANGTQMSRSTYGGEDYIEEEILVDDDGNEIFEEEVLVDEDANDFFAEQRQQLVSDSAAIEDKAQGDVVLAEDEKYQMPSPIDTASQAQLRSGTQIYDIEEQKRILGIGKPGKRSSMSWFIPLLSFCLIIAAIVLVVFFVVLNDERQKFGMKPSMAPTPAVAVPLDPEASSSGSVDAARTTEFDPFRNNCNFEGSLQPNIIDQCICEESVDIIADDVRNRWNKLVKNFIPSVYPEWNEAIDSCSPENQALLWLSSGINNGGEIDDLHRLQRYVLATVYYAQGGIGWFHSKNWLSGRSVCGWEGVECNSDSFVQFLSLDFNNLIGFLSNAPTLLNAIEGYSVVGNSLEGFIPYSYFASDTLNHINFSDNELYGAFPTISSTNSALTYLNIGSNNLDGTVSSDVGKLSSLKVLNIDFNAFSGTLPSVLFRLPLAELSIGGNGFDGMIPEEITDLSALTSLSLGPNSFSGDVPTSLSVLTKLEKLSIEGIANLGGRLPAAYGLSLTNLVELGISGTNIDGNIPAQFSMLKKLKKLRLSDNDLRGVIPSSIDLLADLEILHLNGNSFSGTVPSEIAMLSSLEELKLDRNKLVGSIPEEFEELLEMRTLTLNGNAMDGRAPNGVCALREAELDEFVVDCPTLVGESDVYGIICSIPSCCTECFDPTGATGSITEESSETIIGVASEDPELSFLVSLIIEAGLIDPLSSDGPFTLFAPTNAGVVSLLNSLGLDPTEVIGVDPSLLYGILTYHVVPGIYSADDISDGLTLETAMGESISFEISEGVGTVNGAIIRTVNIPASNGVIHKIEGVLVPSILDDML